MTHDKTPCASCGNPESLGCELDCGSTVAKSATVQSDKQRALDVFNVCIEYAEKQMECSFSELCNNIDVEGAFKTIRAALVEDDHELADALDQYDIMWQQFKEAYRRKAEWHTMEANMDNMNAAQKDAQKALAAHRAKQQLNNQKG